MATNLGLFKFAVEQTTPDYDIYDVTNTAIDAEYIATAGEITAEWARIVANRQGIVSVPSDSISVDCGQASREEILTYFVYTQGQTNYFAGTGYLCAFVQQSSTRITISISTPSAFPENWPSLGVTVGEILKYEY